MSSSECNPSADLRFLYLVKKLFKEYGANAGFGDCGPPDLEREAFDSIEKIMGLVSYGVGLQPGQTKYGTKPMRQTGLPDDINNVNDAEELLRDALNDNMALRVFNDSHHNNMEKICDIHVFSDGSTNMRIRTN